MDHDLLQAQKLLENNGYTCVLCLNGNTWTCTHRGIRPLLELLDSGKSWRGYSAADKVVGKATALLYVLLGVKAVYAHVASAPAAAVLAQHGIPLFCGKQVDAIVNCDGTGFCPMETAVWDIADPHSAPDILRAALAKLQAK